MRSKLGATAHLKNRRKKQRSSSVVSEGKAIYKANGKDMRKPRGLVKFEIDFLRKEKADILRNFHIVEALYKEAVTLGIIPLKNALDGIEVDLRIAKVVNSV